MAESENEKAQTLEERVEAVVEEVIRGSDVFIVDVEIRGQKGSRAVDIFLDSETEFGIDRLSKLSREIGFVLETEDFIAGRYNLNVSSPGADRPLKVPAQYRKHIGRPLKVVQHAPEGDQRQELLGDLLEADDEGIVISDGPADTIRIAYKDIETARVQLPW